MENEALKHKGDVHMEVASARAKQYSKLKTRLILSQLLLTAAFLIVMLFSGASVLLRDLVAGWSRNFYLQVFFLRHLLFAICWAGFLWRFFAGT
ncbi:MAG: hypothetical protein ACYS0C_09530 [Planctomycetota bacterium]|jgi:hypothetical protein